MACVILNASNFDTLLKYAPLRRRKEKPRLATVILIPRSIGTRSKYVHVEEELRQSEIGKLFFELT